MEHTKRYEVRIGKWGAYHYDLKDGRDVDLAEITQLLNDGVKACNDHERLVDVCKKVLALQKIWLPKFAAPEHQGEAEALHLMRGALLDALKSLEEL
ncbi:MAG: hypothetical protein GY861_04865 [bacterium]|nr:hypothetical protein [bacterium]